VGLIATYARWKGQDLFLEAIARLAPCHVPVRFYLIGGPIYGTQGSQFSVDELRERLRELGLTDRVGLVGFRADPAPAFQALDVVVHASTRPEPFGLTIIEAMACGRAVIVAGAGGAAELFRHDQDALGFPPGDATALAEVMHRLIQDPALRDRLGVQARRTVVQRYNSGDLGPKILEAYAAFLPASCQGVAAAMPHVANAD
jgi:glycosyltransferase involved in cell wall biosynthesis